MKHRAKPIRSRPARSIRLTKVQANLLLIEATWKAEHMAWPEDRAAWARLERKLKKVAMLGQRRGSRK